MQEWQIHNTFKDELHPIGKGSYCLNPDKILSPYHITYPIRWTGFLNNMRVEILQKGVGSKFEGDFEIIEFPIKFYFIRNQVYEDINSCLRVLD